MAPTAPSKQTCYLAVGVVRKWRGTQSSEIMNRNVQIHTSERDRGMSSMWIHHLWYPPNVRFSLSQLLWKGLPRVWNTSIASRDADSGSLQQAPWKNSSSHSGFIISNQYSFSHWAYWLVSEIILQVIRLVVEEEELSLLYHAPFRKGGMGWVGSAPYGYNCK